MSVIKSPKPFTAIQSSHYNKAHDHLNNKIVINTEPRFVHFDLLKDEMSKTA